MKKLALIVLLLPAAASASPHPLPFSYPHETLPSGRLELEQYIDLVPSRVARENPDGTSDAVYSLGTALQTEIEIGLTDRLEFGWYFTFQQAASADPFFQFDGVKQRFRYRMADTGDWPIDVGLYLELAELHDELELEEKILLSKRIDAFTMVVNLWVEQEYNFEEDEVEHIFNPTAGVTYELNPHVIVGAEYWARGHFGEEEEGSTHHYLGPTALVQMGEYFLSMGVYVRLDGLGDDLAVGDPGRIWVRTVLGIGL